MFSSDFMVPGVKCGVHLTAVVHPKAQIAEGVCIGAFCVIDEHVSIGTNTVIDAHAVITGWTEIGQDNRIGVGAVIGLEPQDLKYKGEKSFVKIGDRNNIREYVQIHRGTTEGSTTMVGNENFLLGFSHVAHNCEIGNQVVLANGALLAGYVVVEDYAFISGNCLVHQYCRIGKYAMMRGGARVSLDIPPYCIADDTNSLRGINTIGLERRGFPSQQIREIKKTYKNVFNSEKPLSETVKELLQQNPQKELKDFLEFIQDSPRGICRPHPADKGVPD